MAISMNSLKKGGLTDPARILIHGVAGIGKTTLGAMAPNPVFIQTEDGLSQEVDTFGMMSSFEDVLKALEVLILEEHNFQTLVIDSIDWLEPLIWKALCQQNNWDTIESPGYGKGYVEALSLWREYIKRVNAARNVKGMTVIQIAHSQIKTFNDPERESYDRYQIKLHEKASSLLQEHSDAILFANYQIVTTKEDAGFGNKKTKAAGLGSSPSGARTLYTQQRPAFLAKNRFNLPDEMPLDWRELAPFLPGLKKPDVKPEKEKATKAA